LERKIPLDDCVFMAPMPEQGLSASQMRRRITRLAREHPIDENARSHIAEAIPHVRDRLREEFRIRRSLPSDRLVGSFQGSSVCFSATGIGESTALNYRARHNNRQQVGTSHIRSASFLQLGLGSHADTRMRLAYIYRPSATWLPRTCWNTDAG
jgi:hypothetical protein